MLASCASTPPPAGDASWIAGRLSVRIEASEAHIAQSMSAGFELQSSRGEAGELRLNSPLGTRLATAQWSPGTATLSTSSGLQRFPNLDDLSRQVLGESLPLAALPDWLRGRPWPGAAHSLQATGFEQLGWQVQLARQREGLIEATRAAPPAVTVRIRLEDPLP